jgi:bifunctional non-homologous end joining protein LigD
MDLFERKDIKPMLIGETSEAFDSPEYLYELKLDGERCIAYLDSAMTELRNKRNDRMLPKVPELSEIHKQVKVRCILDGELIVIKDGKPDFSLIQRRSLMSDPFKIKLASAQYPASFTPFDILYYIDHQVTNLPLDERKELLAQVVNENPSIAVSRCIEKKGIEFYRLAEQNQLEGIVAKRKDSLYFMGKRTKDWIKIKNLQDDDFVICGYIKKDKGLTSIILGQYNKQNLVYKGHVTMGVSASDFMKICQVPQIQKPLFNTIPPGNEKAVWLQPLLVCTVIYMMKHPNGSLRQPQYKGLRLDKSPYECITD